MMVPGRIPRKRVDLENSIPKNRLLMWKHVPNLITFTRIGVLLALVWLVMQDWTGSATLAFGAILYGSISDFVDGYLARKFDLITNFGKILDALVDKVMTLGSFFLLFWMELLVPVKGLGLQWIVLGILVLMTCREVGITLVRIAAAGRGLVLAAEKSGKAKTIWQVTSICVLFAVPMFDRDVSRWLGDADLTLFVHFVWLNGLFYFLYAVWLTLHSGYRYFESYVPALIQSKNG